MNISDDNNPRIRYLKHVEKNLNEGSMLIVALIYLGLELRDSGTKYLFSEFGLDVETFEILLMINLIGSIKPNELSKNVFMHPAKITRVLDRLENMEAIIKTPDKIDRRSYTINLTDHGLQLVKQGIKKFKDSSESLPSWIGKEKFEMYKHITLELIRAIDSQNANEKNDDAT